MAIDDIDIFSSKCNEVNTNPTVPPLPSPQPADFGCDFEAGSFCSGWSSDPDSAMPWIVYKGVSPQPNTGPHTDHTTLSTQVITY